MTSKMASDFNTIGQLLGRANKEAKAILAPGRQSMSYGELADLIEKTGKSLALAGIKRQDKIAIVLPNGPEMASAFLAVANCCAAAPLNPAYKQDEFAFYLKDLNARLLICNDANGAAAKAARSLDIPISIASMNADQPAGTFSLELAAGKPRHLSEAQPDDIALVLHTSGTTSRPKIVPLSHRNITASARNIARSLALSPNDRCLNIMPLFHIHGLIAAVLSTLGAGGSIYCTPGFNGLKIFGWLDEAKPSWYSAVPTMHQAIVARAARNSDIVTRMNLRFVRSSSSSLPPQVMADIENIFNCPVVEAYGMSEAAHQMTSNPLGRGEQKPGSVGLAAGPKVAILAAGKPSFAPEVLGEIIIKGENVTSGYEANDKANAENFITVGPNNEIWFRTGDQGRFDEDGYLFITGRLKEIINRGGEKISPREVDEVLMDHEAVEQAVTFAVGHKQLGEDVAAAIVLKEGKNVEPKELRAFAAMRLAAFKVPRKILIVTEIPKGPTGKLQRIGLAEKLGLEGPK
ncbi:Long-chain-fatty-acid--CoA ligase [hydrothermal vent metagenome]|uniref:Long-chain-fatty-acid--CoA ligase n=1 Tax=hydrothermal vent metagenome TaxID=652676 RepID=A0A3B0U3W4_9ZZZZ